MIDFTNCPIDRLKMYGGANGNKIGIIYNDEHYMLKFPQQAKLNDKMSYANSTINEYLSCQIIKEIGLPVQETILGKYQDKIVVACKDFEEDGYILKDFAFLKNTIISSSQNGYGTDINDILSTIYEQNLIESQILEKRFWDQFVIDGLLGNFDRHNGNWGFLINEYTRNVKIAPIYDCGSCIFPQADESLMLESINNQKDMDRRIYIYPTSAIKYDGSKINYYEFMTNCNNENYLDSLKEITEKINLSRIFKIIDRLEGVNLIYKTFTKKVIESRYNKILAKALDIQLGIKKYQYPKKEKIMNKENKR